MTAAEGKPGEKFIRVKREWCKRCGICVEFCPKKVFETDEKGYPVVAHLDQCVACGLCTLLCPDFAVFHDEGQAARYEGR